VFPGDLAVEERLASIMRWNALAMVVRANQAYGELGGHIASYASAADLFEVGFNHFFHAREGLGAGQHRGDLVFFQPHSAPGVYARAFLEGRLSEQDLHYRQEITAPARARCPATRTLADARLLAVPHRLHGHRPHQQHLPRALHALPHRNLLDCTGRKVWGVFGDGEMDEPESMSALTLAAREGWTTWSGWSTATCSAWTARCAATAASSTSWSACSRRGLERGQAGVGQRLGRPVRPRPHRRAGAHARRHGGRPDADLRRQGRALQPRHFFGQNPELAALAQGMTDEQIDRLKRGGHDLVKIHAAYAAAARTRASPR
jgi:pyruvate dehydrogenase E1 component